MAKTLVTGGGGQLGTGFRTTFPGSAVLGRSELDITDRRAVMRLMKAESPAIVVNAAAFTKVDAAEADPVQARRVNALGVRNVAEAAESVGALLVQVSTDYVFSGTKVGPYSEDDQTGPLSVYGSTKLEGELAAAACSRTLVVRTSWVFGEGHNFIRSILEAAWSGVPELKVVSDQVGLPTYAPHLAEAIMGLAESGATGFFHLAGSGSPATWAGLAEHAIRQAGLSVPVRPISTAEYVATRAGPFAPRPANSVLDCSKAAAAGVVLPAWTQAVSAYAVQCIGRSRK